MDKMIISRFSRQSEPVRLRKIIRLRVRREIRFRLIQESVKQGISVNVILNNLLEREYKKNELFVD